MKYIAFIWVLITAGIAHGYAQTNELAQRWHLSRKSGVAKVTFDKYKGTVSQIKTAGKSKLLLRKSLKFDQKAEGLLHSKVTFQGNIKTGDTCIYMAQVFKGSKPVAATSWPVQFSQDKSAVSGNLYFPERVDSIVLSIVTAGKVDARLSDFSAVILQGPALKDYSTKLNELARNASNTTKLRNLGMIWGELKYRYPAQDWDRILLDALEPAFNQNPSELAFEKSISFLLKQIDFKQRHKWEKPDSGLMALSGLLEGKNERARIQQALSHVSVDSSTYFIPPTDERPVPIFQEKNPDRNPVPEIRSRLLFLFRYWNIIDKFYPYKKSLLPNWTQRLQEFIPKMILATSERLYAGCLMELNASIGDGHAAIPISFINFGETMYDRKYTVVPAKYSIAPDSKIIVSEIDPAFAKLSGIQTNDVIVRVNGIRLDSLARALKKYIGHPHEAVKNVYLQQSRWLNVIPFSGKSLEIVYRHEGEERTKVLDWSAATFQTYGEFIFSSLMRQKQAAANKTLTYFPKQRLLLLKPDQWNEALADSAARAFAETDHLVIDCRVYPDWQFLKFVEKILADNRPLVRYRYCSKVPGRFETQIQYAAADGQSFEKEIYVLISEESESRSELLAMMLKSGASRCKLIGRRTAGADGDVASIPPIGNQKILFRFSAVGVEFPDGKQTQQTGINPDIHVADSASNTDEIFNEVFKRVN
ncbi:hypothetical protein C7T94_03875 [Pedobacter yulinensis]|uniref:Tail specific protease domain-containing protein n=1 Tax=Pedobacter yulinensis TaxID=2126353 RepID=A0A2T3HN76_9SPHI|nr:S41 family peptidase [Pedobacter yulinensis]PST83894.1 hypothetical protein C7T94_03875 [Pedobacter yulinensis]